MPKLITVSENLLKDILPHLKNSPLEKKIKDLLENTNKYQTQNITYFPKKAKVERIVDGDTIVLSNGSIVRYVGITAPENNEPFEKESTEANKKLVEGKTVTLEYDNYHYTYCADQDKFEINATLESDLLGDKMAMDGGNIFDLYEVGSSYTLIANSGYYLFESERRGR